MAVISAISAVGCTYSIHTSLSVVYKRICSVILLFCTLHSVLRTLSPPLSSRNVLSQSVPSNLLPLHLLPCNRQLSAQVLKRLLGHLHKRPVERFLVIALCRRDARHDGVRGEGGDRGVDGFGGVERHVAVFVVVHIDVDLAGDVRGLVDGDCVDSTETTVPIDVSQLTGRFVSNGTTHQKLFGEYRFATSKMATAESFSIGYTP